VNVQNHFEKKPIDSRLLTMQSNKQQKNINKGRESKEKYIMDMKKNWNNNNRKGE
jgi:hypothetical protein